MTLTLSNPLRPAILAASRSERMERTISRSNLTRKIVTRFVPGAAEEAAVDAVKDLVQAGRFISVDYLGEDISHAGEAEDTVQAYLSLLQAYGTLGVELSDGARPLEVSIKLSALGQSLPGGDELALANARRICTRSRGGRRLGERRRRGPHHDRLHTGDRPRTTEGVPDRGDRAAGLPAPHRGRLP